LRNYASYDYADQDEEKSKGWFEINSVILMKKFFEAWFILKQVLDLWLINMKRINIVEDG